MATPADKKKDKKSTPIPTTATMGTIQPKSKSSIAQEFKRKVKEAVAEDNQHNLLENDFKYTKIEEKPKTIPMFDYFKSIYRIAFVRWPSPPDGGAVDEVKSAKDLGPLDIYNDFEEFSLPHERPQATKFEKYQLDSGITITVESVQSFGEFIIGDHAGSSRLMRLETEMNIFYGKYLIRKMADNRELVFDVEEGGYYAVFVERHQLWARSYVTSLEPPRRGYYSYDGVQDPEQIINVVLVDYGVHVCNFKRKQFLPLKRSFLQLAIQKMNAQISWHKDASFPPDIDLRDFDHFVNSAAGQQYHAVILQYKPETQPLPTVWLELSDPQYED